MRISTGRAFSVSKAQRPHQRGLVLRGRIELESRNSLLLCRGEQLLHHPRADAARVWIGTGKDDAGIRVCNSRK